MVLLFSSSLFLKSVLEIALIRAFTVNFLDKDLKFLIRGETKASNLDW